MIFFLLKIKRIICFFLILLFLVPTPFLMSKSLYNIYPISHVETSHKFQNNDQQLAYALGVSLVSYIHQSFEMQKKIGINLAKDSLLKGVQDALSGNLKISREEILLILRDFKKQLTKEQKIQIEKNLKENLIQGELYMKNFAKLKGVKKTPSGLLYLLEKPGTGKEISDNTKITVHYQGRLVNGMEFDNSYIRGRPISIILKDVILGWQEGLKYVKKGGKIILVIPPYLAYGSNTTNGIPGNSTLIFNIELLDTVD